MKKLLLVSILLLSAILARAQAVIVDNVSNCSTSQGVPVYNSITGLYGCSAIVNTNSDTRLVSGGSVAYSGTGLVYTVQAATYMIAGNTYTSPQTDVTLTAADGSNPRIDLIVFNTSSVATKVTGSAATPAVAPSIDPTTQLYSGVFAYVNTSATTPTNVHLTNIYLENTEWTTAETSPTGTFTLASTNNPYAGTKDVEATTVGAADFVTFTNSSAITVPSSSRLVFYIRSKAKWSGQRALTFQWYNSTTLIGNSVTFNDGAYGFNSSTIASYQQIVIPISNFNLTRTVDILRITVSGGGAATIGFYLDNITLQTDPGVVNINVTEPIPSHTRKRMAWYNINGAALGVMGDGTTCSGCVGPTSIDGSTDKLTHIVLQTADANGAHSEYDGGGIWLTQQNLVIEDLFRLQKITNARFWSGVFDNSVTAATVAGAADPAAASIAAFRYDSAVGTTWYAVVKDGATINAVSTGIAAATTSIRFKIIVNASAAYFYINDVLTNVLVANLPVGTTLMQHLIVMTQTSGSGGPTRANWYGGTIIEDTY